MMDEASGGDGDRTTHRLFPLHPWDKNGRGCYVYIVRFPNESVKYEKAEKHYGSSQRSQGMAKKGRKILTIHLHAMHPFACIR